MRPLLDGDALRRSVSSLGEVSYEVVETSGDGEHATVRASIFFGVRSSIRIFVCTVRARIGAFDKWAIDEASLPSVKVNIQGVEAATINNRKVAVDKGAASFPVFYPACMRCRMIRRCIQRRR